VVTILGIVVIGRYEKWGMADHKIGALPIMRDSKVVGIITETDLFKIFLVMLGAREPGVRLDVLVPKVAGELAKLTGAIYKARGNILALGTFLGESSENWEVTIRFADLDCKVLVSTIEPFVECILDIRVGKG
jgi:acetoin utilization protein AcuB